MYFNENELIIIIKEIMDSLKEEGLLNESFENEDYNFPITISNKLNELSLNSYIAFINKCETLAKNLLSKYSYELNSMNMLHEEILEYVDYLNEI